MTRPPGVPAGVLAGVRVVEVAAFVAAPQAGATLAAMGADVIRLEQRGGGVDARRWPLHGGRSLYRDGLDRGKRSVAVDLRSAEGRELAARIATAPGDGAGLVVTNLPAGGWLSYQRLAERRPDLVMVVIEGRPGGGAAVDYTVNAGTGFPFLTGPASAGGPVNHVLPSWDLSTGLLAATSLLAAERHRRLTGEGQLVEIALADVALTMADHLGLLAEARLDPEPRGRHGNHVYGTWGRDFATADGRWVMICALTPRQWSALVTATGIAPDVAELERANAVDLGDEAARWRCREEIAALVEPWVGARTLAEAGTALDAGGVLWGPYRTFKQLVAEDPRAAAPVPGPARFGLGGRMEAGPPPDRVGQHTAEVLSSVLGLGPTELSGLRARGVIDEEVTG